MANTIVDEVLEDDSRVLLVLRQGREWNDVAALGELQDKLNGYANVVTEGLLVQKYPDLKNKPVVIRLFCYQEPPPELLLKLDSAHRDLKKLNIGLEIIVVKVGRPKEDMLKKYLSATWKKIKSGF